MRRFAISSMSVFLLVAATALQGCRGCGREPVVVPTETVRPHEEPKREYGASMDKFVAPGGSTAEKAAEIASREAELGSMREEAARRGMTVRALVVSRAEARLSARIFGKGDARKVRTFRYFYKEVTPGAFATQAELVKMASDLMGLLAAADVDTGRPFILIPESSSGWINRETLRVCASVGSAAVLPAGLKEDTFKGADLVINAARTFPENGSMDEMERWAETALAASAGGNVDFAGPFMLRFVNDQIPTDGTAVFDWVVPVPGSAQPDLPDDRQAEEGSGEGA